MYFFNKVNIFPKHFVFTEMKPFSLGKEFEMNGKGSAQKGIKGTQKSAQRFLLLY